MKKYLICIIFSICYLISYALNFNVYPTRFEVDSKKITTDEMTVVNNTTEPLRVEIYPEGDKNFGEEYNLNSNIKLFPKAIAVKPGGRQTVRFRVKPDEKMKDGEYRSYIVFKEIPYDVKTTTKEVVENKEKDSKKNISTGINFITEVGIPVFSIGENKIVKGEMSNFKYKYDGKNIEFSCNTNSTGNTAVIYKYSLKIDGEEEKTGIIGYSKRSGEGKLEMSMELKEGLKGKRGRLRVYDQTDKEYYNQKIRL